MSEDDIREPHLRHADFLGAFALVETDAGILMVANQRRIGGREVTTWDLPGGQVEPGERLHDAVRRELHEETGLEIEGTPEFLFLQEGVRETAGVREYAWRSFFFRVDAFRGEPQASREVLATRWVPRAEVDGVLGAPYHDSFATWLAEGGVFFESSWSE